MKNSFKKLLTHFSPLSSPLSSLPGFTLIEMVVVLGAMSIITSFSIASLISYSESQLLQSSALDIVSILNVAKSRSSSQVKPTQCGGQGLSGYRVNVNSATGQYDLSVVCGSVYVLSSKKLSRGVHFGNTSSASLLFPVFSDSTYSSTNIVLSKVTDGRQVAVGALGNITVLKGDSSPASTITPTSTFSTPTPMATLTPTPAFPTLTPTPIFSPTPTPLPMMCTFVSDGTTVVPANLALNRPSFASSSWQYGPGYEVTKAFDGNVSTRWQAASGAINNQWVSVDLGSGAKYNRVLIKEISYPRVTSYKLQWSNDDINYANIAGTTGTTVGDDRLIEFPTITSRYVRVYFTTSSDAPTIDEVEVYNVEAAGSPAVDTYTYPFWTNSISGARWIWSSYLVQNPTLDETKIFTKTFQASLPVTNATLTVAVDNTYSIFLNGSKLFTDSTGFTFLVGNEVTYNIAPNIRSGANYLSFQVTNSGIAGETSQSNPAGLLYKLKVNAQTCTGGSATPAPNTIGLLSSGKFYLRNSNTSGAADMVLNYSTGDPNEKPVAGDWDGDGKDTIGLLSSGKFYLRNSNTSGAADMVLNYSTGITSEMPVAGTW